MTANIYEQLYRHFHRYDYRLSNSFVYEWESDFFAQSSSGYFIEVEVKVSRGDFFRDFAKPKHSLFRDIKAGKSFHITHEPTRGGEIGTVKTGKLVTEYGDVKPWNALEYNWRSGRKDGKWGYWVNDYGHSYIKYHEQRLYAPATRIDIRPIQEIKCPNQLYYACPEGLIKPEEVPDYAGLIYISHYAKVIKKAPYIHKRKQNMDSVLLKKFYNLWQFKTTLAEKVATATTNPDSITT
jgi:hypothetical protein